jgi:predicted HicB family RNase H-like nuclease
MARKEADELLDDLENTLTQSVKAGVGFVRLGVKGIRAARIIAAKEGISIAKAVEKALTEYLNLKETEK